MHFERTPLRTRKKINFINFTKILVLAIILLAIFITALKNHKPAVIPEITASIKETAQTNITLVAKIQKIEKKVKSGDTFITALKREGLPYQVAYQLFNDVKPVYNLKRIKKGQKFTLYLQENRLVKFRYDIDPENTLWADRLNSNSFSGKLINIPYTTTVELISHKIKYSLFESILAINEKAELAELLARIYEYDIDFNRDIRENDSFTILVEKKYLKGRLTGYGNILASEFTNRGKTIRVIRYTDPKGNTSFYHTNGRAVKRMFLRCPLPFMKITSRYGYRKHPILGFSAKHLGIDLAAPIGTKVRATASGVVITAGWDRLKGRFIKIRHANRYLSNYYHLHGFARSIRSGKRVEQGQVIGYVGNTGKTTGPHLHYGLMHGSRFINPLSLKSPAKNPINSTYLSSFKKYVNQVFSLITINRSVDLPKNIVNPLFSLLTGNTGL